MGIHTADQKKYRWPTAQLMLTGSLLQLIDIRE